MVQVLEDGERLGPDEPRGGQVAGAAVGVGVGANGLLGSANSFALQPFSVQGEVGLNLVATVTGLYLESVLPARQHRHYRRHRH